MQPAGISFRENEMDMGVAPIGPITPSVEKAEYALPEVGQKAASIEVVDNKTGMGLTAAPGLYGSAMMAGQTLQQDFTNNLPNQQSNIAFAGGQMMKGMMELGGGISKMLGLSPDPEPAPVTYKPQNPVFGI